MSMPRTNREITTDVFVIPYEGAYVVYAPLRRLAFVTNAATVNAIARLKDGEVTNPTLEEAELIAFLESVRLTGKEGDVPIVGLNQPDYKPNEVTLFLTAECNLRCVYCYARAGDLPPVRMTKTVAERGINEIVRNALELSMDWIGVHYHGGGEPTVNHQVLVASHDYAKEQAEKHGLRLYSSIATNGVLSKRGRRWLIENLDGASISLDGRPEVNDVNRPNVSGGGSGAQVMRTLAAFDESNFPYGIRVTVSSLTVYEMVDTVRFILEHTNPERLQIEPVYDIGRGEDVDLHVDTDAFINGYRECRAIAQEHGVTLGFSAARIDAITSRFCRAYGEGFSLTPKGNVSGCYEVYDEQADFADEVIFGHYDEEIGRYVFDEEKLTALREHNVEQQPWCNGCFARWHCSGDCPNKVRHASVDGKFEGMPSCNITRTILLDQILEKIDDAGGIIWMEQANHGAVHEVVTRSLPPNEALPGD